MTTDTLYLLLPEIVLALAATLVYLGGAMLPARAGWSWLSAASILLAGVALYQQAASGEAAAAVAATRYPPIGVDPFSTTLRWGALAVGLVFVLLAARTSRHGESSEFMGSLLLIVAGLMLVALANDLVLFFVGLELISIPTYVILYLGRGGGILESGTKYFFLSVLSSALLLYGFSFLYGATGSTFLGEIQRKLALADPEHPAISQFAGLAMILIFAGVGFRLTAVPFHFYAPDVYQGTTNPNAGLLAVVPKIAALAVLARVTVIAMPGWEGLGGQLALALAIVTMTVGNLLALWQSNIRRLMAYSSIAHAGYMLIGLAVGFAMAGGAGGAEHFDGLAASFFYLLVYSAATAGTFAALTFLSSEKRSVDTVDDLAGLSGSHPKTAAALAVFMFSLTGLPPLAGFWGKLTLFTGALSIKPAASQPTSLWYWFLALAIVGAVNAAISAAYYLRIVAAMYFRPAVSIPEARGGAGAAMAAAACALVVLAVGCYPGPTIEGAGRASQGLRAALEQPPVQARPNAESSFTPHISRR